VVLVAAGGEHVLGRALEGAAGLTAEYLVGAEVTGEDGASDGRRSVVVVALVGGEATLGADMNIMR
jgi:hypothetical protein